MSAPSDAVIGDTIGIRDLTDADLPSVLEILNAEIIESPYLYMETPVTVDERREWLAQHRAAGLPVLAATRGAVVVGWGSLSEYRPSSGYRRSGETSVYVHRRSQRRGIARQIVAALHDRARAADLHAVVASIDSENAASIALFERLGYREVARLPEVGRKFDRWRTQLFFMRTL